MTRRTESDCGNCLDGGQVRSSSKALQSGWSVLSPSNTKWVSYRPGAQKNWSLHDNKSSEAQKIKLDVCSFGVICLKKKIKRSARKNCFKWKKTVHLEGVEEAEQQQVGWGCQGRTIFWLTSLELELPRGITAPDLSASSTTLQLPSFTKKSFGKNSISPLYCHLRHCLAVQTKIKSH